MIKGFLSCAAYYTLYCIAYWPIQVKKNEVKHPKSIKFEAPHEKGRGRRSWTGVKFQRGGVWNFLFRPMFNRGCLKFNNMAECL